MLVLGGGGLFDGCDLFREEGDAVDPAVVDPAVERGTHAAFPVRETAGEECSAVGKDGAGDRVAGLFLTVSMPRPSATPVTRYCLPGTSRVLLWIIRLSERKAFHTLKKTRPSGITPSALSKPGRPAITPFCFGSASSCTAAVTVTDSGALPGFQAAVEPPVKCHAPS